MSYAKKIVALILVVIFVLGIVIGLYVFRSGVKNMKVQIEHEYTSIAKLLNAILDIQFTEWDTQFHGPIEYRPPYSSLENVAQSIFSLTPEHDEYLDINLVNFEGNLLYSSKTNKRRYVFDDSIWEMVIKTCIKKNLVDVCLLNKNDNLRFVIFNDGKSKFKGQDWVLVLDIPEEKLYQAPLGILKNQMLVLLGVSVIGLFVAFMFSRSLVRPIKKLKKIIERVGKGKLEISARGFPKDEIGELADSVVWMAGSMKRTMTSMESLNSEMLTRQLVEEELRQTNKKLKSALDAKNDFLAKMTHELRTPLNCIIGFSEVLKDQTFGTLNEKQTTYVNHIRQSGIHLLNLIKEILNLSEMKAEIVDLTCADYELDMIVENVLNKMGAKAQEAGVEVLSSIDESVGIVHVDFDRIRYVIEELLTNAIKFTPKGGQVGFKAKRNENEVEICIWDTGIGIEQESREKIFSAFEQADSGYSRRYEGLGLGLVLCKRIIEMHKGQIWFESEGKDKGTCFYVELPTLNKGKL